MSKRAWTYGLTFAFFAWVIAVVVIVFWHWLVVLAVGLLAWRVLATMAGVRSRRRKSSWASLVTAGSAAFAAWNSRWLRPAKFRAKVVKEQGELAMVDPEAWDDIPY